MAEYAKNKLGIRKAEAMHRLAEVLWMLAWIDHAEESGCELPPPKMPVAVKHQAYLVADEIDWRVVQLSLLAERSCRKCLACNCHDCHVGCDVCPQPACDVHVGGMESV